MVQDADVRKFNLHDVAHFDICTSGDVIFILHGRLKINSNFGLLGNVGIPLEIHFFLVATKSLNRYKCLWKGFYVIDSKINFETHTMTILEFTQINATGKISK